MQFNELKYNTNSLTFIEGQFVILVNKGRFAQLAIFNN